MAWVILVRDEVSGVCVGGFFLTLLDVSTSSCPPPPLQSPHLYWLLYSPDASLGQATSLGSLHTAQFYQLSSDFVSISPITLTSNEVNISVDSISLAPVGTEDVWDE